MPRPCDVRDGKGSRVVAATGEVVCTSTIHRAQLRSSDPTAAGSLRLAPPRPKSRYTHARPHSFARPGAHAATGRLVPSGGWRVRRRRRRRPEVRRRVVSGGPSRSPAFGRLAPSNSIPSRPSPLASSTSSPLVALRQPPPRPAPADATAQHPTQTRASSHKNEGSAMGPPVTRHPDLLSVLLASPRRRLLVASTLASQHLRTCRSSVDRR